MVDLIQNPVRRLFAFGCSFTNYQATTWPEIIAEHLDIPFFNFGKGGTGNLFSFNQIMMADSYYNFTDQDLVIVCWTNIYRTDSFQQGLWQALGNVNFKKDMANFDLEYYALRDYTFIELVDKFLTHKKCQYHFLSMCDLDQTLDSNLEFRPIYTGMNTLQSKIQPSFYKVLWNNNLQNKFELNRQRYSERFIEFHPSPQEHYNYLCDTFGNIFSKDLKMKVYGLEKTYYNFWTELLNDSTGEIGFHTIGQDQHEMLKELTTLRRPENYGFWLPKI